jgi:sugar phosphate isomerase/epimerase
VKPGIGSYTYPWAVGLPGHRPKRPLTPGDLLDRAVSLHIKVVQICDNMPLDQLSPAELDALKSGAARAGIELEVGTRGIGADHMARHLGIARKLGSKILRVVVDRAADRPTPDAIVRRLRKPVRDCRSAGITLAIENHDRFPTAVFARIVRRLGRGAGICLDTANSLGSLEGTETVLETLGLFTVNLHVKDIAVRRMGHMLGFTVTGAPAGKGQLDIPALIGRLKKMGKNPNVILEQWVPPQKTLPATIRLESAWATTGAVYLKRIILAQ